jgi:3-dehydroquinate synthase
MREDDNMIIRAGAESYPVIFSDYRRQLAVYAGEASKIVVISNATVFALYGELFVKYFMPRRRHIIPLMIGDGENYKTQATVSKIYDHLLDIGVGRRDIVISFGGGIVGDVAGYAAATFKRGVNLIHVPTTLLAMVDSSIGGKTAVNHRLGKNLIGSFYQPRAVVINPEWLATLGSREMVEGLAEIIKAGFLSSRKLLKKASAVSPTYLPEETCELLPLIREAIRFKAGVVARDVREMNYRAILNFGHTFGHAIEKAEGYRKYRHGEAVMAGMAGALFLSHLTGHLSKTTLREYLGFLAPFTARLRPLKKSTGDYVIPIDVDKKNRDGQWVFVLLDKIGKPRIKIVRSRLKVIESINRMKAFVNNRGEM